MTAEQMIFERSAFGELPHVSIGPGHTVARGEQEGGRIGSAQQGRKARLDSFPGGIVSIAQPGWSLTANSASGRRLRLISPSATVSPEGSSAPCFLCYLYISATGGH
jgi:hypothetical protein